MAVYVHHRHRHDDKISRPAIFVAFALALTVLTGVTILTLAGVEPVAQAPEGRTPVQTETVLIDPIKGGGIALLAPDTGERLAGVEAGRDGFVRTVLRGLDRVRVQHRLPIEGPVEIVRWAEGGLTLRDPSTQWSVELASFGEVNLATFLSLMSDLDDRRRASE